MLVLTDQQADEMLCRLTSYCKEYSLSVTDVELRKRMKKEDMGVETKKTKKRKSIVKEEEEEERKI